jgi:Escherichia/Staphylococcus phage prohead protease
MSAILYRTAELAHSSGREIFGRAVPYSEVVTITEANGYSYREQFVHGSFARSIAERSHKIRLMVCHDHRKLPVGKAVELREERDGLYCSFEVANTTGGNDLLELVRAEVVTAFSIGFTPVRDRRDGDVVTRVEASLREVSAVTEPAYSSAEIAGVRSGQLVIPLAVAERRLRLTEL